MKQYRAIDLALDPFPYGGGTTTCDALWMGVPTVTLSGQTAVGRGGVSLLNNVGLGDWVADTEPGYIELAIRKASEVAALAVRRFSLRPQMHSSPLMNARQFTRDLEAAYRQMWHEWCAK